MLDSLSRAPRKRTAVRLTEGIGVVEELRESLRGRRVRDSSQGRRSGLPQKNVRIQSRQAESGHRQRVAEAAEQVDSRESPPPVRFGERRLAKNLEQPGDGWLAGAGKRPRRRLRQQDAFRVERFGKDLHGLLADSRASLAESEGGGDPDLETFIAKGLEQRPLGRPSNSSKSSCCRRALRDGGSAFRGCGQEIGQLGHGGPTERFQRVHGALAGEVVSQTPEEQRDRAFLAQTPEGPGAFAERMGAERFQQRTREPPVSRGAEVGRDAVDDGVLGEPESGRQLAAGRVQQRPRERLVSFFFADRGKSVGGEASGLKNGLRWPPEKRLQRRYRHGAEGDHFAQVRRSFHEVSKSPDGDLDWHVAASTRPRSRVSRVRSHSFPLVTGARIARSGGEPGPPTHAGPRARDAPESAKKQARSYGHLLSRG